MITASQAEMAIVLIMRFLSQMAMLCHVGTEIKLLIRKTYTWTHMRRMIRAEAKTKAR
jgi:hypothetical protein